MSTNNIDYVYRHCEPGPQIIMFVQIKEDEAISTHITNISSFVYLLFFPL